MSPLATQINSLPIDEKYELVYEILDSIAVDESKIPVSEEDRAEVMRRLEEYKRDGIKGDTWEVVRKRIESKLWAALSTFGLSPTIDEKYELDFAQYDLL